VSRFGVKRLSACRAASAGRADIFALAAAWALLPGPASAQDANLAEQRRWIPSLALTSGVTFQEQDSSGVSNIYPAENPGVLIDGTDWAVSPYVGVNAQLMTPSIPRIPGRPRFFVSGEVLPTFSATRDIAKDGDPSGITDPPRPLQDPRSSYGGVGLRTTSEVDTWIWSAHLGIAFPFQFRGRDFRAKVSAGWLKYKVNLEGLVRAVDKPDDTGPVRKIELFAEDSSWFDGVGPGLELEMDTFRWGPIGASLYVDGHAYKILGDRKVEWSDSVFFPAQTGGGGSLPPTTYTADWSFEVHPWMFRAGLGMRFHWLGR
jgi:hypothetical protein